MIFLIVPSACCFGIFFCRCFHNGFCFFVLFFFLIQALWVNFIKFIMLTFDLKSGKKKRSKKIFRLLLVESLSLDEANKHNLTLLFNVFETFCVYQQYSDYHLQHSIVHSGKHTRIQVKYKILLFLWWNGPQTRGCYI